MKKITLSLFLTGMLLMTQTSSAQTFSFCPAVDGKIGRYTIHVTCSADMPEGAPTLDLRFEPQPREMNVKSASIHPLTKSGWEIACGMPENIRQWLVNKIFIEWTAGIQSQMAHVATQFADSLLPSVCAREDLRDLQSSTGWHFFNNLTRHAREQSSSEREAELALLDLPAFDLKEEGFVEPIEEGSLVVVHAQEPWFSLSHAENRETYKNMNEAIAWKQSLGSSINYLIADSIDGLSWTLPNRQPTRVHYSSGGENNYVLHGKHVTVIGGFFGGRYEGSQFGCHRAALRDLIAHHANLLGSLHLHIPVPATYFYHDDQYERNAIIMGTWRENKNATREFLEDSLFTERNEFKGTTLRNLQSNLSPLNHNFIVYIDGEHILRKGIGLKSVRIYLWSSLELWKKANPSK